MTDGTLTTTGITVPDDLKGSTVLLADDDELSLMVLTSFFKSNGFNTLSATDGRQAMNMLDSNDVDVVMSDLRMPEISGLELLELAKEKYPDLIFVMFSGFENVEAAVNSIKGGAEDYIVKPCEPQRALTTVVRSLERRRLKFANIRLEQERQEAAAALTQSETKYKELVENANDLIYTHDLEGRITSVNHVAMDLTGYSIEEVEGQNYRMFLAPEYHALAEDNTRKKLRGEAATTRYEVEILSKDGSRIPLEVSTRLLYRDGVPYEVQAISRDMSQWKRVERDLRAAKEQADDATKLKDKFVSLVSHDLRSPIGTVTACLNIVRGKLAGKMDESSGQLLERALSTCEGMVRMIDQLLNITRLKTGKVKLQPRFIDAHSLAAGVLDGLSLIAGNKGVALINEIPPMTRVYADYNLMFQVIQNLVSNAIKFCRNGDSITVSSQQGDRGAVIAVKDTGAGVNHKLIPDLFRQEVKTTTPGTAGERGTGLGLPLCKDIVDAHDGKIWVESEEGAGSVFYVWLPEVKPVVLVAGQDEGLRRSMIDALMAIGAETGEAADEAQMADKTQKVPHLVVLDTVTFPDSGLGAVAKLRENSEADDTAVIVLMNDHDANLREKFFHLNVHDFISREAGVSDVADYVRRFIF